MQDQSVRRVHESGTYHIMMSNATVRDSVSSGYFGHYCLIDLFATETTLSNKQSALFTSVYILGILWQQRTTCTRFQDRTLRHLHLLNDLVDLLVHLHWNCEWNCGQSMVNPHFCHKAYRLGGCNRYQRLLLPTWSYFLPARDMAKSRECQHVMNSA